MEENKTFRDSFMSDKSDTKIIYASKVLININLLKVINEEGLNLGVVSGGKFIQLKRWIFLPIMSIFMGITNWEKLEFAFDYFL